MRPAHWQKIRHPKQPEILASHTAMPKSHEPPAHSTSTRRYRSNSDTELMQTRAMAAEIPSPPACEFFFENLKTITHHPTDGLSLVFPLPASANMPKAFSSAVSRFLSNHRSHHRLKPLLNGSSRLTSQEKNSGCSPLFTFSASKRCTNIAAYTLHVQISAYKNQMEIMQFFHVGNFSSSKE